MSRSLGATLLLAGLLLASNARAESVVLEGTLGTKRIRAALEIESGAARLGEYFYVGNDRVLDLASSGGAGALTESDPETGDETGSWEITVQGERVSGTWSDPAGKKRLPIALERSKSSHVASLPLESWKRVWGKTRACTFESKTLAQEFVRAGGKELAQALREAQTRVMENLAAEPCIYPEERVEGAEADLVNGKYQVECATEALRVEGRFVSVHWDCVGVASENDSPVGAHPTHERHALLFDLETRRSLALTDWVTLSSVEGEVIANGIYLAPLGIKLFFADANYAMAGYTDTLPYAGLTKNLERIGEPTSLAAKLDF